MIIGVKVLLTLRKGTTLKLSFEIVGFDQLSLGHYEAQNIELIL